MDASEAQTPPPTHPLEEPAPLLTRQSKRNLIGISLSLLIHLFMLAILGLILLDGPAGTGERRYGPALEVQAQGSAEANSESDAWLDESLPDLSAAIPMPEIAPEPAETELSIVSAGGGSPASLAGGAGDSGASESGLSLGGAASGGASFFGVEVSGSRIAYIVDASASMAQSGKIGALKRELLASLQALPPGSEFIIVVFSDEHSTRALGGAARWRDAGEQGRADVETAIRALAPSGGTQPLAAFRIAFTLEPKPEAVYFMTDGVLPQNDSARIIGTVRSLNERSGPRAPIHTIAFGSQEGAEDLRRIARQSGGTYTYVSAGGR